MARLVSHPRQSHPTYSPSIPPPSSENSKTKGLNVAQDPNDDPEGPREMVQRHSPDRLLRRKVDLPGGITISAEKHRGRIVVRIESPALKKND